MKPFSLNIALAALAASLFLCCAEVPEELANDPGNEACSGGAYYNSPGCPGYAGSPPSSSSRMSSSSSAMASSSSAAQSSSSSAGSLTSSSSRLSSSSSVYVSKGNNISNYRTVQIGSQVWMAENLNYNVSGSACYENLESNCDKYGRLYDWATAMNISSSYNSSYYYPQENHRGICPSGWHIPSNDDWDALFSYVGGSSVAGKHLKAASGWNDDGNGLDSYGFAALPGGGGRSNGFFNYAGYGSTWWSASEFGPVHAYGPHMSYYDEGVNLNNYHGKRLRGDDGEMHSLYYVRCLQDNSQPPSSSGKGNNIANYKTVKIGSQTWMAENLNYAARGSVCYENLESNCDKYGRLYGWETAMALPSSCNSSSCASSVSSRHQGICPSGWHIPSNAEWDALYRYADGTSGTSSPYASSTAGKHLKATSGWNSGGNGTDTYGFAALPGGRGYSLGSFDLDHAGGYGYWWSASESDSSLADCRMMLYDFEHASWSSCHKSRFLSVRCLQD